MLTLHIVCQQTFAHFVNKYKTFMLLFNSLWHLCSGSLVLGVHTICWSYMNYITFLIFLLQSLGLQPLVLDDVCAVIYSHTCVYYVTLVFSWVLLQYHISTFLPFLYDAVKYAERTSFLSNYTIILTHDILSYVIFSYILCLK